MPKFGVRNKKSGKFVSGSDGRPYSWDSAADAEAEWFNFNEDSHNPQHEITRLPEMSEEEIQSREEAGW